MDGKKFRFPHRFKVEELEAYLKERRCLVVSFFGKTTYAAKANKGSFIDETTGGSHFRMDGWGEEESVAGLEDGADGGGGGGRRAELSGVFDADRDVVFLHMRSCMDTFAMAESCKRAEEAVQQQGFLSFWSSSRYEEARALLLLFTVSHILVCCQPGYSFDVSYIHLFKSLDNLRNKVRATVTRILREVEGIPKDWLFHGRPCPPRVLFLFLSAPLLLRGSRGFRDERKDAKPHRHPPIKRLEFSLEDQIYRILRKARIITNISANSLFAVPANQGFVFVETGDRGSAMDPDTTFLNTFFNMINRDLSDDFEHRGPFYHQHGTEELKPTRSFSKFLTDHINFGFEKGFYDNVSKHGPAVGPFLWEIPRLSTWLLASDLLYNLFTITLTTEEGTDHSGTMCDLRDDMETETMFSELRCRKILPQAIAAYEDNLPPHYTAEYHSAKLLQAMSVYSMQARGPASEKYAEKLAAECTDYWQSGRMRCEELSLTGNNCANRRHTLPGQDTSSQEEQQVTRGICRKVLPSMKHHSGVQYIAACNCGRRQANREDPFTLVDANYSFYQEQEEDCCSDLEHIEFPVFQAIKLNPATVAQTAQARILEGVMESEAQKGAEDVKQDSFSGESMGQLSPEKPEDGEMKDVTSMVADMKVTGDLARDRQRDSPTNQDETDIILEVLENIQIDGGTGKSPMKVESLFARASSQTESLSHMKTLTSPPGLKPEFPSWSLVMIGSSHVYSHSSGLSSMPGFMSSSKFLLPWEVPLTKVNPDALAMKWSNVLENAAKRANVSPEELVTNHPDRITVKVFIGFEYECPRGHRFMVSAPDKPMKSSSTMREAANRLVTSDLPLYMACPCWVSKPPVAQLTRVHVVTPKAPVYVTLFPQVQPSVGGPVFVTGWETPHRLMINSYWVMRLPYVYWGEGGAHLPPLVPPTLENPAGVLLKGCISIDEDYVDG